MGALIGSTPGDGFTSSKTTIGELYLFAMLHQLVLVSKDFLDATPALHKFYSETSALPGVAKVLAGQSAMGGMEQYFIPSAPGSATPSTLTALEHRAHAELFFLGLLTCALLMLALLAALKKLRVLRR